jgi:hypothetical protein
MKLVLVVVFLALGVSPVLSENRAMADAAGAGTETCGQFAAHYKLDPDLEATYFFWAQGFMTGMNVVLTGAGKPVRNLRAKSIEAQQRHIRSYCDQHPLSDYGHAVVDLFFSLPALPESWLKR